MLNYKGLLQLDSHFRRPPALIMVKDLPTLPYFTSFLTTYPEVLNSTNSTHFASTHYISFSQIIAALCGAFA